MQDDRRERFERLALPHLDAAHNLARWLAGNAADAEDILQEAYLRAYRYFDSFGGADARLWLLGIVRNTFLTWIRQNRSGRLVFVAAEPAEDAAEPLWTERADSPEALLIRAGDAALLERIVARMPTEYREALLLREVEELSYRDIAAITGVPVGTVMSRLARARVLLRRLWRGETEGERGHAV